MSFILKEAHQDSARHPSNTSHSLSIVRATDVDELLEMVRGYQFGLLQLDRGRFGGQLVQTQFRGVLLTAAHFARAVAQSGAPPAGKITFALRMSSGPALWQGQAFGTQQLLFGGPESDIDMVSQPGYACATASFPIGLVEEFAERCGWTLPVRNVSNLLVQIDSERMTALRSVLNELFNEIVSRPLDEQATAWAKCKQDELLHVLLKCTLEKPTETRPEGNTARARALKAALAAIREQHEDVLTVGDLCTIAKARERTLHYAFKERFGVPPAQFVKIRRLNGLRDDLHKGESMTVSDAANKWGFWHIGQLARDYRNLFGELPSETFKRRHGQDNKPSGKGTEQGGRPNRRGKFRRK